MSVDIWMPLYIGEYLAATAHLGALESGAYLHLLMHQWKNGSLPAGEEALRRIARVEVDAWSNAWAELRSFFDFASGAPVQRRLEGIRVEWAEKQRKSVQKATRAAAVRWGTQKPDAPSNAKEVQRPCPSSSPSPMKEERGREVCLEPDATVRPPSVDDEAQGSVNPAQGAGVTAEDLRPLAVVIALEHPRGKMRAWQPADVPLRDVVAVVEAIRAEAEQARCKKADAALMILERVRHIADKVPREEWRFVKDIAEFMRLREYRMEPEDLYRKGGRHGRVEPYRDERSGGRVSASVQRGVESRDRIGAAAARRRVRRAGTPDEGDPGTLSEAGTAAGDAGHVAGPLGGDGGEVRAA